MATVAVVNRGFTPILMQIWGSVAVLLPAKSVVQGVSADLWATWSSIYPQITAGGAISAVPES